MAKAAAKTKTATKPKAKAPAKPKAGAAAKAKPAKSTAAPKSSARSIAAKKAWAARKVKALVPKIAQAKAEAAAPPTTELSKKAHPRQTELKSNKRPVGLRPKKLARRDMASVRSRDAAKVGRSQLNFRG